MVQLSFPFITLTSCSRHQTFLQLLYTLQGELLSPEAEAELPQEQDLPEDKPQESNTGDCIGASKVNEGWDRWTGRWREILGDGPYPLPKPCLPKAGGPHAGDASMPWLPGGQQHKEGS